MNVQLVAASLLCILAAPNSALAAEPAPVQTEDLGEVGTETPATTEKEEAAVEDRVRFRWGINAEGGPYVVADEFTLGLAGVNAGIGVQINNMIGIYALPQLDVIFGDVGGVHVGIGALVDFTIADWFSVGAGPDTGAFLAFGGGDGEFSAAGGTMYGARFRAAFFPFLKHAEDSPKRKALAIGVDARLLTGDVGGATVSSNGSSASATDFVFIPLLTIGYQSF